MLIPEDSPDWPDDSALKIEQESSEKGHAQPAGV
jgi:hypothetical protein